jgi:APA family basic amino acid/polyamine antiporter
MTYRVPCGLAAMIGAGIFTGLAPAARVTGAWLLAAVVLAALLAVACGRSTSDNLGPLGMLGRVAGAAAIAGMFGSYVLPAHPVPAAAGLLAVAAVLTAFGARPARPVMITGVAVVLAGMGVLVAACLAIEPAGSAVAVPEADNLAGLPAATLLMYFGFLGFERAGPGRRGAIVVALGVYLAVGYAALRQLGAPRLALSPAPLRDALAAADAAALDPILTVAAGTAAVLALLGVFADLRRAGRSVPLLAGVLAAVTAALLSVPVSMGLASALMLARYAWTGLRRHQRQDERQHGERDGDHERAGPDVPREEPPAVAPVPPDRPGDRRTQPEQDAEPADPHVAGQDEQPRQQRRHDRDRGDPDV